MSDPLSPPHLTDPVPLTSAHVPTSIPPPASTAKTGRRSVRLFAPDGDSSSDEEGGPLIGGNPHIQDGGVDGAPPANARSASYPGPTTHPSPTSRLSAIVSSASAAQPKLARAATFVAPSSSSSTSRPPIAYTSTHGSGSSQSAGLSHHNDGWRSRLRPDSLSKSLHTPGARTPGGSGSNGVFRGRTEMYNDPEASYFHSHAGPSKRRTGRTDIESDDEEEDERPRSAGWQMGISQFTGLSNERTGDVSDGNNNGQSQQSQRNQQPQQQEQSQQPQIALTRVDNSVSNEEKQERLDWQGMLESVLTSDVLKIEEARISQAMPTESFREEFGQSLWWQIRAKLRGRTEAEEKRRVQERRARVVDTVLEEVATFKARSYIPTITNELDGTSKKEDKDLGPQHTALEQVNLMLAKLAAIKALYPNLAAMRADKPTYASSEFRAKTDALTAWSTVVTALQIQLGLLQKWTGSDDLDITKPNTTKEKALTDKSTYTYHPLDSQGGNAMTAGRDAADDSSFLDRVMKEDNLQRMFERRAFIDLINLVRNAKETVISYLPIFEEQNLPDFQYELVRLIGFPGRLIIEALKVRLDAASRLVDPNPMVVSDFIENLRLSISLAVLIRKQYDEIIAPDDDGRWKVPHCLPPEYNDVMLDAMRAFFKLLHWRLRGVGRGSYFKETEVLEDEGPFLYEAAEAIEGGDMVVAEHSCALSNKLLIRSCNYLDQQLRVPQTSGNPNAYGRDGSAKSMKTEEMISWYGKLLDSARMRHRKTQRYCRRLTQRFDNSAEYSLEHTEVDALVAHLQDSGHFLVYTNVFEGKGTYIVADGSLWAQPDEVRHLLQRAFSVTIPGSRARPRRTATSSQDGDRVNAYNADNTPDVQPVEDGDSDNEDDGHIAAYLLLLSPRQNFVWTGAVMTLNVDYIEYMLQDNRVRLIADGPTSRLALCKHLFAESLIDPETGESLYLPCLVEAQAHLPSIQGQLLKIAKSSYRLSECIVQSAPLVRNAFRGAPGSQDLVENWYSFATDHGTRVSSHIDPSSWERFSRLLMRLAISWISFICQECNPTDRKTFRWTVAALTYAFTMTRGNNILALDRAEFSLLRRHVGNCVSLLISHFDILGARSSLEAKKEADRIEAMRRLQRLQENLDDEFLPRTPSPSGQPRIDRSIRLTVEERLRLINELEQRRNEAAPQPVGTVLDEEVSEDRALVFLAASKSNISMRWQQGAYIGGGASGSVYLGYSLQDNTVFAVKILPTVDIQSSPALYESIKRESDVMSLLSHPNIVGFLGLEVHRNRVCLFQEYCEGGSLAGMLEYGKIDDEEVVGAFTIQLLRGLDYLHQNRIEHRDLKPENILIGANSVLKLADFGTAKIIKGNKTLARTRGGAHAKMEGLEGTPMYMAPEMIKNIRSNKLGSCDIWGLGCVVLQMITGRKPWSFLDFDNEWAIMFHLGATTEHPPLPEPNEMSELGIEWIERCLSLEPDERPTAPELLADEWLEPMLEQMAALEEDYPDVLAAHETEAAPPPPEDLSTDTTPSLISEEATPPLEPDNYEVEASS